MSHDTKSEVAADAPILLSLTSTADAAPGGHGAAPEAATDAAPAVTPEPAAVAPEDAEAVTRETGRESLKGAARIAVDRIRPDPDQPRTVLDGADVRRRGETLDWSGRVRSLADDMARRGQLTPIQVRWSASDNCYLIISGHRRWEAAKLAGLETMACVVVEHLEDRTARLLAQMSENSYRDGLTPVALARSYSELLHSGEFSSTYDLGRELHIHASSITRLTVLLNLPDRVLELVEDRKLGSDAAYELTKLVDSAEQVELAEQLAAGTLTRAELRDRTQVKRSRPSTKKPWTFDLEGVVRVTVRPLSRDTSDAAIVAALEGALEHHRAALASKAKPGRKQPKTKTTAPRETVTADA